MRHRRRAVVTAHVLRNVRCDGHFVLQVLETGKWPKGAVAEALDGRVLAEDGRRGGDEEQAVDELDHVTLVFENPLRQLSDAGDHLRHTADVIIGETVTLTIVDVILIVIVVVIVVIIVITTLRKTANNSNESNCMVIIYVVMYTHNDPRIKPIKKMKGQRRSVLYNLKINSAKKTWVLCYRGPAFLSEI